MALDNVNAMLNVSIAVGAETLTLTTINDPDSVLSTSGASYSAIILDGPNTETVTCTGNATGEVSGDTIAVTATAYPHSAFVYVIFQVTSIIGPTVYFPLETFKPSDMYEQLYDQAIVGSLVDARDEYVKVTYAIEESKFKAWPSEIQNFFMPARTVTPSKPSFVIKKK